MTSLTVSRPTQRSSGRESSGFLRELGRAISSIAAGARAAREYNRLSSRTDAALAREGIARNDIPRVVFERHIF